MKVMLTGASGFIGHKLAHELAKKEIIVHAMIRNEAAIPFLQHNNIRIFKGDILNINSLKEAMKGCEHVFHVAASTNIWSKKKGELIKINCEGTENVLETALSYGITKFVFTSSGGLMGPSNEKQLTEEDDRTTPFELEYDISKKMAEDVVLKYVQKGLHAVIVRPTKVFGPGNTKFSYTANNVIKAFLSKRFVVIPGFDPYSANFTFIDDVVAGHLLAMEHGISGEKYILGGENISYFDFFDTIRKLNNGKGIILKAGKPVFMCFAYLQQFIAKMTGGKPIITPATTRYLFADHKFSSERAMKELGYSITPFTLAMKKTINFLNN